MKLFHVLFHFGDQNQFNCSSTNSYESLALTSFISPLRFINSNFSFTRLHCAMFSTQHSVACGTCNMWTVQHTIPSSATTTCMVCGVICWCLPKVRRFLIMSAVKRTYIYTYIRGCFHLLRCDFCVAVKCNEGNVSEKWRRRVPMPRNSRQFIAFDFRNTTVS